MSKESAPQGILQQESVTERTNMQNTSAEEILFLVTDR